jgi:Uma2 family endonuclease
MGEAGLLDEDDRVELIDGEVVDMNPVGGPHISCVIGLTHSLMRALGDRCFVSVQNPIHLRDGREPQPDLSLLKRRPAASEGPPEQEDVLLVIEVSDTTLAYDRDVKLRLYAEDGIPEVPTWTSTRAGSRCTRSPARAATTPFASRAPERRSTPRR